MGSKHPTISRPPVSVNISPSGRQHPAVTLPPVSVNIAPMERKPSNTTQGPVSVNVSPTGTVSLLPSSSNVALDGTIAKQSDITMERKNVTSCGKGKPSGLPWWSEITGNMVTVDQETSKSIVGTSTSDSGNFSVPAPKISLSQESMPVPGKITQ